MLKRVHVAPLVGAWIEILIYGIFAYKGKSLLSWERGLKSSKQVPLIRYENVAPLVGAWIEITLSEERFVYGVVAPLVGAWIEISTLTAMKKLISVAPLVGAWIEIVIYET